MGHREDVEELIRNKGEGPEPERLQRLFDLSFAHAMAERPESATMLGQPGHNHRWTDWSMEAVERRRAEARLDLDAIVTFDRDELSAEDALSLDVFTHQATDSVAAAEHPEHLLAMNQLDGPQVDLAFVLSAMPTATRSHLDDVLARLRGIPDVVDQTIALLEHGVHQGITAPQVALRDVPAQVDANLGADPLDSPLLAAFRLLPDSLMSEKDELTNDAAAIMAEQVGPAMRRLREHLVDRYLPAARQTIALSDLPGGPEWYAARVRHYTTTDATPQEIHDVGRSEVDRIAAEMKAVRDELGFEGTAEDFATTLAEDPRFTFPDGQALLASYRDIAKRVDATVLRLFRTIPRLPFAVVPVPAEQAPSAPMAFYLPGSLDDGRPGQFFANTHDLASRPSWNMESTCLHEAVPGHHFQLTLAQELDGVPTFRKHVFVTAYLEGWGLYCESLGPELGMYDDPYQRYGALDNEMMRAVRLVVDTGIHALGWSRKQAIDFFRAASASPIEDIVVEVDRYIVLPGQALAYKTGELKLQALRAKASTALGDRFDIRDFHHEVLRHGCLPLDLLEAQIDAWVARA
ncbi:MAG TPA: DUF885 domain-containing protein [Acidimicrobiales bacterium]|nr:DUF885 domain-containing protein [Acidimicrobiales bacterium]